MTILDTRVGYNGLSTRARVDKQMGYVFIDRHDRAPSVGDTLIHEYARYEVVAIDRADAVRGTRRIHILPELPKGAPKPEPLADWERELLYGTTGPMPTPEIIKAVLQRSAGREVKAQIGENSDRHLKSLLGHAIVLAKQEMQAYQKRETARKAKEELEDLRTKPEPVSLVPTAVSALNDALASSVVVAKERPRPTVAETLEAVAYYVDNDAWEGRFERLVRSIRKPLQSRSPLASGGYVHGGVVPVGTSVHGLRGSL